MCDYSLMEFSNRLAVDGEVLAVRRFPSGCLGLAAPAVQETDSRRATKPFWKMVKDAFLGANESPAPAVCVPPGARLILHNIPAPMQKSLGVTAVEEVKFIQLSSLENQHRDAVCFRNGKILRVQELQVGQQVEVVDLGNDLAEVPASWDMLRPTPVNSPSRR